MNTWVPLWLLRDIISTLQQQLSYLAKKDDTKLETAEILIRDDYENRVDITIRAYSKDKKDYAYAKRQVTGNIIQQTRYTPPLGDFPSKSKTPEQMMKEIMGKLEVDSQWSNEKDGEI